MAKGFKTGGRVAGVPNKVTQEFRQTITALLEKNAAKVDLWLQQVAEGDKTLDMKPDPARALDLLAKLAEYGAPKLNRTELSGPNGGPIEGKTSLDVSGLSPEQLRAVAAIRLNGE